METKSTASAGNDDTLVIVLHIEEGIGLNSSAKVWLQTSLSDNKLDGEPINTGTTTSFDCNLVWETDRKSVKRMKIENLPLKVDVYALKNFKDNVEKAIKEHIGYILVPVRNIPLIPLNKALQVKPRWYKLIGLGREWRQYRPELLMNVMITDKEFLTCDKTAVLESHGLESVESIVIEENPNPGMLTSQKGMFIRLLQEEGLLQVGNIDTECDVFIVHVMIKNIRHLDNIIVESQDAFSDKSSREYYINYMLLGNYHTRILDKKFNRIHQVQEKVSINFRSSLKSLQEYFENIFFVPLQVLLNARVIGSAEIRLKNLIKITDLKEFLEKHPFSFEIEETTLVKPIGHLDSLQNAPTIEFKVTISYQATKKLHQTELLECYKKHQAIDSKAGGDFVSQRAEHVEKKIEEEVKSNSTQMKYQTKSIGIEKQTENDVTKPNDSVVQSEKANIASMLNTHEDGQIYQLPRLFSYNLQLKSIKFNRKPPKGIWQISFFHDKADTPRTFINRDVQTSDENDKIVTFSDLELKLYFTSHSNDIMEQIKSSELCTLCIKGPHNTHAKAQLDCKSLLISNKEKTWGNILLTNKNENVIALAEIFVYLDDVGLNFNAKKSCNAEQSVPDTSDIHQPALNITRTLDEQKMLIFDENVAYKMIEELEEWKMVERENFMLDLKKTETMYLEKLKSEWTEKKSAYENQLLHKNDVLLNLTRTLEDAQKSLTEKENQYKRHGEDVQNIQREMEKSYNSQLLMIKERARRLEEDLMSEVKSKMDKIDELESCNKQLRIENCELRQSIECLKKSSVHKEDYENLLHEMKFLKDKLEASLQSKVFYKEQWAKTFREYQKEKEQHAKEYLFNTKYDRVWDVLSDEHCILDFDKEELDEIKHCLNLSDNDT